MVCLTSDVWIAIQKAPVGPAVPWTRHYR